MELRELLHIRRLEEFPGRNKYRQLFRKNLRKSSRNRFYIFNIFGEGKVGKTFLLKDFRDIARADGSFTSFVQKELNDIPSIMGKIYNDIKELGISNSIFEEHYSTYIRLRSELENDPGTSNLIDFIGSDITNIRNCHLSISKKLAQRLEIEKINYDKDTRERFEESFLAIKENVGRCFSSLDDIRLIENPIDILSFEFLKVLNVASSCQTVVLLFDDYQVNENILNPWLTSLVKQSSLGTGLPENTILVISSLKKLDREYWSLFESFTTDIKLSKFIGEEISLILNYQGIQDNINKTFISKLTGGVPLHLQDLVKGLENKLKEDDSLDEIAILESFLNNRNTLVNKQLFLDLAIPRFLNEGVYNYIAGSKSKKYSFELFRSLPCLYCRSGEWIYEASVRKRTIDYRKELSNVELKKVNSKLSKYYRKLIIEIEKDLVRMRKNNPVYLRNKTILNKYQLEFYYHEICSTGLDCLSSAVKNFVTHFIDSTMYSADIANTIFQAGEDCSEKQIFQYGRQLVSCLDFYEEKDFLSLYGILNEISEEWQWLDKEVYPLLDELKTFFNDPSEADEDLEEEPVKSSVELARRYEIVSLISDLPRAQFEQLLFTIKPPSSVVPGDTAPQANRTYAFLQWSEGPGGCGLETVFEVVHRIIDRG
jgi:hypothetical protein